jgi:hypothetical protein
MSDGTTGSGAVAPAADAEPDRAARREIAELRAGVDDALRRVDRLIEARLRRLQASRGGS